MGDTRKPTYEHVTAYLLQLETSPTKEAESVLYREFMPACYEPDITDHDYGQTLDENGLHGKLAWTANVESLDLKTTVALLTFILRADRFIGGLFGAFSEEWLSHKGAPPFGRARRNLGASQRGHVLSRA